MSFAHQGPTQIFDLNLKLNFYDENLVLFIMPENLELIY